MSDPQLSRGLPPAPRAVIPPVFECALGHTGHDAA